MVNATSDAYKQFFWGGGGVNCPFLLQCSTTTINTADTNRSFVQRKEKVANDNVGMRSRINGQQFHTDATIGLFMTSSQRKIRSNLCTDTHTRRERYRQTNRHTFIHTCRDTDKRTKILSNI